LASVGTLELINGLDLPNLAILLVDGRVSATSGEVWLNRLPKGALAKAKESGSMRVAGPGELLAQLERLVDEARRRIVASTEPIKANDPALSLAARAQGISPEVQPNLIGLELGANYERS
jgi:hypothetical protein